MNNVVFYITHQGDLRGFCFRGVESLEFGAEMVCGRMGGLSKRQREICKSSPEAMIAISEGIRLAMDECHYQFRHHRWNCSVLNKKHPMGYVITVGKAI